MLADVAVACADNDAAKAVQEAAAREQIAAARNGRIRFIVETRREENILLEA